jgi:hypothetical protein
MLIECVSKFKSPSVDDAVMFSANADSQPQPARPVTGFSNIEMSSK